MKYVSLALLAGLALVACAPKARPISEPAQLVPPKTGSIRPASQGVSVSEDLARLCKISVTEADRAPKFDYDRSELSPEDRTVLDQIARCVTTGPLRGRALRLVGRADPRGETEYNLGLGGHRAANVRVYLTQLGVDKKAIAETSRGELDSSGTDETGWRRDRRVDVVLQ